MVVTVFISAQPLLKDAGETWEKEQLQPMFKIVKHSQPPYPLLSTRRPLPSLLGCFASQMRMGGPLES